MYIKNPACFITILKIEDLTITMLAKSAIKYTTAILFMMKKIQKAVL